MVICLDSVLCVWDCGVGLVAIKWEELELEEVSEV